MKRTPIINERNFTFNDLLRELGVSHTTLNSWVNIKCIVDPIKNDRGWRMFSEYDLKILQEHKKNALK
jgi:DNA-binding transcriptional MerR regulator